MLLYSNACLRRNHGKLDERKHENLDIIQFAMFTREQSVPNESFIVTVVMNYDCKLQIRFFQLRVMLTYFCETVVTKIKTIMLVTQINCLSNKSFVVKDAAWKPGSLLKIRQKISWFELNSDEVLITKHDWETVDGDFQRHKSTF